VESVTYWEELDRVEECTYEKLHRFEFHKDRDAYTQAEKAHRGEHQRQESDMWDIGHPEDRAIAKV
jgi:hypothetical protein